MKKELAYRENDGIGVTLYWHSTTNRVSVTVHDWRNGDWFELAVKPESALEVFEHPYAYATAPASGVPVYA